MYCRYCGTQISDSAKFCSNCGAPKTETSTSRTKAIYSTPQTAARYQPVTYSQPVYTTRAKKPNNKKKKKKRTGKGLKIILIIVAIYMVIGIIGNAAAAVSPYLPSIFQGILTVLVIAAALVAGALIYSLAYFKGKKFTAIKDSITKYVTDCNELNVHIEDLRASYINIEKTDYGEAEYSNVGRNNYRRTGIANAIYAPNIYDCSRTVCDNARKQPFKYICKYFNVPETEESLEQFEEILNNFSAAEEGKELSVRKREDILSRISTSIPWLIRKLFPDKLSRELGFEEFQFDEFFFPVFTFRYISSGGNSGTQFDVTMDIPMLERFIHYLSERVKFKKSAEGQRRLMTPALRRYIINRDEYTCQQCRNSTMNEPNLLLEVDHIIPVSKGGLTEESNLQTLCWKCNRTKGAKIYA